jgi:ATP-binding cassette subfamily B protein
MVSSARQLGPIKNALARVMELLDAPEETSGAAAPLDPPPRTPVRPAPPQPHARPTAALARAGAAGLAPRRNEGVRVDLDRVSVRAGGHVVLEDVDLHVAAGDEIAIVGASGAGKSTLLGLLLGWYQPATGRVRVGGRPLDATSLPDCRRRTAWLDPTVHLYNRRLVQNLLYGSDESIGDIAEVIEAADLRDVLEKLPEGLQTVMGEGGALVSGGEGQRVRLGRALLRRDAALVLLDEPFRGLDRDKRKVLLNRVRRAFAGATILCVTHDVSHTLDFGRVLVVEGGRVVEDGDPRALACDMASRYQAMLTSEQFVLESLWSSPAWRRFRVEEGVVVEQAARDYIDLPALVSGSDEGGLDGG